MITVGLFALAALMIASQVISRLYLGYHWLTDTLSSVGLSMMITALTIAVDTHLTARVPELAQDPGPTTATGDLVR
ncbi:phosphatase PAP2 family protein [Curtobacterium sp. NPDC089689]|uniref:phosphatase PAP2 family protein n=1 Tax=Curtobacterium sp. NPDC089689 TaxID=3363968 RepID=UPI00380B1274